MWCRHRRAQFARLSVLAGSFLWIGAHAAPPNPVLTSAEVEQRIERVERGLLPAAVPAGTAGLGERLSERLKQYRVPGLSVAVVNEGKVEWARGYGVVEAGKRARVTPDTLFQAGSISKVVAALGALKLVQQGRLSLDEDVNRKLVSWKVPENPYTRSEKVTLRRLLTHTAGLTVHGFARYRPDLPVPTLFDTLEGRPPAGNVPVRVDFRPGSAWRYSAGGYVVLEQLVADVTREPFGQYVGREVLVPLGMQDSDFQALAPWREKRTAAGHLPDRQKVPGRYLEYGQRAAAGLWTTPSDLARLIIGLQETYAGRPGALLNRKLARELFDRQPYGWGLGLELTGAGPSQRFFHGGSNEGFDSLLTGYVRSGQGLVVMSNANLHDPDDDLFGELERAVAIQYRWLGFPVVQQEYVKLPERVVRPWRGRYRVSPGVVLDVDYQDGHLDCYYPGEGVSTLYPKSENEFFPALPILATSLSFKMVPEQGSEQEAVVVLRRAGQEVRAQRISTTPLRSLKPLTDADPSQTEPLRRTFSEWSSGGEDLGMTTPGLRATYGRNAAHYLAGNLKGLQKVSLVAQEEIGTGGVTRMGAPVRWVNTYRAETKSGPQYLTVHLTPNHEIADYEHFRR